MRTNHRAALLGAFPLLAAMTCILGLGRTAQAQCPQDDAAEPNDTCTMPLPGTLGTTTGLVASTTSRDWWLYSVPPGQVLTINVFFSHSMANLDAALYTHPGACGTLIDASQSNNDNEQVSYTNSTNSAINVKLGVFTTMGVFNTGPCGDYTLVAALSPNACSGQPDDSLEDNDSCGSATPLPMGTTTNLWVTGSDEDFYSLTLNAGDQLHLAFGYATSPGETRIIDSQIIDAANCSTVLSNEHKFHFQGGAHDYTNATGAPQDVVLRVFMHPASNNGCTTYSVTPQITNDPCVAGAPDSFEDNDSCIAAAPITVGHYGGLRALRRDVDIDWYTLTLPQGATITVDLLFTHAMGNIECYLWRDCDTYLTSSFTNTDNEQLAYSNAFNGPITLTIEAFVSTSSSSTSGCVDYGMSIDIQGGAPSSMTPYCFGDGSGTPCPCGNNSPAGHAGGCAHASSAAAKGGLLSGRGVPSVTQDSLSFDLRWAKPNSFALLLSGVNRLPQVGSCAGCGIAAFDGLRCAGGSLLRHGTRSINLGGIVDQDWGGPAGGLIAAGGFSPGSTRHFFAMFRTGPTEICQQGQNSSNGVSVTFLP